MSMEHRAHAFDWTEFESDLLPLLVRALLDDDIQELASFIKAHRDELRDPYEGEPLSDGWRILMQNGDVQELGEFALTRYYQPGQDFGLGLAWPAIDAAAPAAVRAALLGRTIGPETNPFDPGRMGAYFQTPEEVERSATSLAEARMSGLNDYRTQLLRCVTERRGLYVTF